MYKIKHVLLIVVLLCGMTAFSMPYVSSADIILLEEDFSDGIPSDWDTKIHSGTGEWIISAYTSHAPLIREGNYVSADSDQNSTDIYDTSLYTPSFSVVGLTSFTLEVDKYFNKWSSDIAHIAVYFIDSTDSYLVDEVLWEGTSDDLPRGEHFTQIVNVPSFDDISKAYVEFWYSSSGTKDQGWFNLDNVVVSGADANEAPTASFSYFPLIPIMDQTVTFDASSSTDTDGSIALYEWDWDGDGTYDDSGTIASITHTFTSAGSHTVTLRVTDDQDATGTSSETIDVNAAPEALFSHDPANPNAGEIITFDASSSTDTDGSIVLYEWDWDDDGVYDATSTTSDASHAFSSVSGHAVTLRITDDDGATDTYTQIIGVNAAPNAVFDHAPRSPLAGQSITFDASPSSDPDGTIVLFEWDWDDDGTYDDTGVLTTFYYVEAGLHDVTLRVTDDSGATDTFTGTLSIRPQVSPLVSFTPMRNMMLLRANTIFTEVHDQLPEDVPDDVSELLDQVSMHMHNATSTANTIYANGELTKAVELMEEILSLI